MIRLNKTLIAFVVGLFSQTTVTILGTFALSEFIVLLGILYLLATSEKNLAKVLKSKRIKTLLILSLVWFVAAIFADIINDSSLEIFLKGTVSIVLLALNIIFISWILHENFRIANKFLWGVFISGWLSMFVFTPTVITDNFDSGEIEEDNDYYDLLLTFRIMNGLNPFSFDFYSVSPLFVIALRFAGSFLFLFAGSGSRINFAFGLISCLVLFIFAKLSKYETLPLKYLRSIRRLIPIAAILVIIMGVIVKSSYAYLAENDYLGEQAKRKYEDQAHSKIGLLAGRSEFVASSMAFADSPLFGHGSYPRDDDGYAYQAEIWMNQPDEKIIAAEENIGRSYIPTHSHIWAALVWHGAFGGLFWLFATFLVFTFLLKYSYLYPKYLAYTFFLSLTVLWNIFFSPLGNRIIESFGLVFLISLMDAYDKKSFQPNPY